MLKPKTVGQSNAFRWLVIGAMAVGTLVIFGYYLLPAAAYNWNQPFVFSLRLQPSAASPPARRSIILYWTSFFEFKDFGVGTGSQPFSGCDACLTTTDRGLLNDSDAVVFHGRDLHVQDLPPPGWRRPHQTFVFLLLESPVHTNLGLLREPVFRNYFNRTMTYRRDSDVLHPYGRILCRSVGSHHSCVDFPRAITGDVPAAAVEDEWSPMAGIDLSQKNRTVAWFVSNCQSNSRRESLARNLSRFIAVDVYGRCGDRRCASHADCDSMLSRHYRFYLSFENSLCPDYVTEKLFRPLSHDTVPVVYGGADYSHFLPAGSYVDARDFESPEALASYLQHLMANDTLYLSYFRWRGKYVVDSAARGWCSLCRFLRDVDDDPISSTGRTRTYGDMAAWWSGQTINESCAAPPTSLV